MKGLVILDLSWPGYVDLTITHSMGKFKCPGDIWDLKLSGLGMKAMPRERFAYLCGEGKKSCRLIAGGMSFSLSIPLYPFNDLTRLQGPFTSFLWSPSVV